MAIQSLRNVSWRRMRVAGAVAVCVAALATLAAAQDVKSYTRTTFDDWLQKYAEAKPDFKTGDTLTVKDLERIRPFMPPGYFEQLNFPELKMEIIAPQDHTPRKDFMQCTEKYQPQVKLRPDNALDNYVCGQPFLNDMLK